MRTLVSPAASGTPDEPSTGAAPDPAAPPRDFPIQRGCPFAAPAEYAAMRVDDPVARVTLPTKREAWVVTRYDDVRELLSDPRVSADIRRPNFPALGESEQEAGMEELRRDASLIPAAIEELLRVLSVADSIPLRVAAEDIELSGRTVPADDGVIALLAGANHDTEQFDDPERVDFHRMDNHHVAFVYGVHQCLGQHLARLGLEVALETLIRRVPTLRLAADRDQVAVKHDSATFGLEELMVIW
ncbi:cytochrome P450 [Streptomyces tubercidicus]|uniref:cytochrome P450 n=1 Tax=Streptomyces tubercidicus TaxID=47759 RepID=UPI002E0D61B7|nr:cytochrome P450 [Streptomyces tubercidicus]WSX24621.1 cytochrome P450 [Streptomyces tubercidicus]